jgi:hypothetical protein
MKPKDRLPEPRVPMRTMVALRAKFLETCGLEGVVDPEGVERPESSFAALGKRFSVCGPIIENSSLEIASVEARLRAEAHTELAISCLDSYRLVQLWWGFRAPVSYRIQSRLYSYSLQEL